MKRFALAVMAAMAVPIVAFAAQFVPPSGYGNATQPMSGVVVFCPGTPPAASVACAFGVSRGQYASATVTPAVQAAPYASGNAVGGLLTFANIIPTANGGGLVQGVTARFASGVTPALDLVVFNASPTTSTITDKVALAVATADLSKVIGVVHISDCTLLAASTESVCQAQNVAMAFGTTAATTLYGALVARSAVTLGSTSDAVVEVKVIQ